MPGEEQAQNHPIEGLMQTAMESIKAMVNVNTILGEPVETPDGTVIVPVSRVSLGFGAGGSEFEPKGRDTGGYPFGGGSGAGISRHPVAFLVVGGGQVRLLPIDDKEARWIRGGSLQVHRSHRAEERGGFGLEPVGGPRFGQASLCPFGRDVEQNRQVRLQIRVNPQL